MRGFMTFVVLVGLVLLFVRWHYWNRTRYLAAEAEQRADLMFKLHLSKLERPVPADAAAVAHLDAVLSSINLVPQNYRSHVRVDASNLWWKERIRKHSEMAKVSVTDLCAAAGRGLASDAEASHREMHLHAHDRREFINRHVAVSNMLDSAVVYAEEAGDRQLVDAIHELRRRD